MRIVVIGATGHIGSYLVPRLIKERHDVIAVSRRQHVPYIKDCTWDSVTSVKLDRDVLEAEGRFGNEIARLNADVIIDLICFTPASARQLVSGAAGSVQHLLHCGTIWVYGPCHQKPTREDQPRRPLGDYGRDKAAIESWLLSQARESGLPATVLHPGHIVGPGWTPLNPAGNFNPKLFEDIAAGKEILLPNLGMETFHHVHADDVAQAFVQAIKHRKQAVGESFNIVSDAALTMNAYTKGLAQSFGKESHIRHLPLEQWREQVSSTEYEASLEHLSHSPDFSNQKARDLLEFSPGYSSLEAVFDAI